MKKQELTIFDIAIRQDQEGRYCLNDLHKAAGGEKVHQPSNWLRMDQTQALIAEYDGYAPGIPGAKNEYDGFVPHIRGTKIIEGGIPPSKIKAVSIILGKGKAQGTYVTKNLVYAYATWISPKFHRHVLDAYAALVTKSKTPKQIYMDLANDLRLALPNLAITDRAVLISDNHGQVNMSGETREQLRYYKEMDKLNLPGIIAVTRKPYKVMFDWFNKRNHSEESRESVYQALADRCAWYKSIHPGYKPFQNRPAAEEVHGIKSSEEVKELAADMAKIVANLLTYKPGNTQPMQRLIGT